MSKNNMKNIQNVQSLFLRGQKLPSDFISFDSIYQNEINVVEYTK